MQTRDVTFLVSWNYCQAIVRPLAPKSGRVSVLLGILSIWGVSGLLAAPAGYYSMLLPISRWRTYEQSFVKVELFTSSSSCHCEGGILDAALPISKFDVV